MWKFIFIQSVFVFVNSQNFYQNCTKVFNQDQVIIESPNYPSAYPPYFDCTYLLKGLKCPTRYTLQLLDFFIESSTGCKNDRLIVENRDLLCGGKFGTKIYNTKNGVLSMRFHTNGEKSGRGFRILITRKQCEQKQFRDLIWAPQDLSKISLPTISSEKPSCCQTNYMGSRFFLTTPGFPYSTQSSDCIYKIYRSNPDVCRLRIHFFYFWIGEPNQFGCNNSYLQIDGKQICGCHIGLKLTSDFDFRWGNFPKVLRFYNQESTNRVYNGFALEIIQDQCPKKLTPEFHHNQGNGIVFPETQNVDSAKLQQENNVVNTKVFKHLYVFEMPEENAISTEKRDVEENTYVDLSTSLLHFDRANISKCQSWGNQQWSKLIVEPLWKNSPKCEPSINSPTINKCEELYQIQGFLKSPSYPYYYPPVSRLCHRIHIQPGYCKLKIKVTDFDLEDSHGCLKDFLLLRGRRYCGKSLFNAVWSWNVKRKSYEEISFVTDGYYCGRGYRAFYEQIPCQSTNQLLPLIPPPILTSCGGMVNRDEFVIEVFAHNQPNCIFNIHKSRPNVCKLLMTFLDFDLACGSETFDVTEKRYCGMMTGQRMTFYFNKPVLSMVYRRFRGYSGSQRLKLRISGRQITDDCYFSPPSASSARLINKLNVTEFQEGALTQNILIKNERGVCGLLLNSTEADVSKAICHFIMERNNQTECVPLASNRIYLPYSAQETKVNFNEVERLDKVMVKEVPCEDLSDIIN